MIFPYSVIIAQDSDADPMRRWKSEEKAYYYGDSRYYESERDFARLKKLREEGGPWKEEFFKLVEERPPM